MYTVTITHTPQADHGPLFTSPIKEPIINQQGELMGEYTVPVEVAKVTVATLDIPALLALIYKTPRARRSDAGKARAGK